MVLDALEGRGAHRRAPLPSDRGSQSLEFVMALPLVTLAVLVVCGAGLVGAELVGAQSLARDTARTAAVAGVDDARAQAREAAGGRALELEVAPVRPEPGEVLTVSLRLRSLAFDGVGLDVWLPARASMRVEGR